MIKIKKILSLLLMVLYVSYYANAHFFIHSHVYKDITVVHSHAHNDSHHSTKTGGHTEQSIVFIDQISHFDYIDFSCNYVPTPLQFQLYQEKFAEFSHWIAFEYFKSLSPRAPPILII
jgi:hypothetical protein